MSNGHSSGISVRVWERKRVFMPMNKIIKATRDKIKMDLLDGFVDNIINN